MAGGNCTRVIQVTNIAPQATKDQMQTLFGHIGKIEEIRLYPTVRDASCAVQSRICYVKYADDSCVTVAQHLTNTVFIDRALIVVPVLAIPDEYRALEMSRNDTVVPKLPAEIVNRIEGQAPQQVIKTDDPKLVAHNLPEYPALPSFYDARKIEETRRTIIVCDVRSEWRIEDLMECFQLAGDVKYARWAEKDERLYCMIEFCEQNSIVQALKMQGQAFKGGVLNVYHSTDAIIKPEAKSNEAAQAEIEEAMSIVKEAQNMISAAIDPVIGMLAKEKSRRSRSRSHSRHRRASRHSKSSKSRTHTHRSRSRKRARKSHSKKRSRSKSHNKRTRAHKRSRSREHRRSHHKRKHSRASRTPVNCTKRTRSSKETNNNVKPTRHSASSNDSKSRKSTSRERAEYMDVTNTP